MRSIRLRASRAAAAFVVLFLLAGCTRGVRVEEGIAITDVTIIDVTKGVLQPGMTVAISGERITVVRPSSTVRLATSVEEVAGTGKYLIPGLWDMHVHLQRTARDVQHVDFAVDIANGITGIRLMAGCDAEYVAERRVGTSACKTDTTGGPPPVGLVGLWRREIAAGRLVGPRTYAASMLFDGPRPCGYGYALGGPDEAREMVRRAQRLGNDFLKIYNCSLEGRTYYAIADEARRLGIAIAGHVPSGVSLVEASAAGQAIEHAGPKLLATCSNAPAEVAAALDTLGARGPSPAALDDYLTVLVRTFDVAACEDLIDTFLANGTVFAPTFLVNSTDVFQPDLRAAMENDERRSYLVPHTLTTWRERIAQETLEPESRALREQYFRRLFEIVAAMDRRGIPILAGSDTPNLLVYPGFGLHDELALLVQAGLTPAAALRAATINPARYMGRADELGSVEEGKLADLVLLDEDPLRDVHNTTAIAAVVARGHLFDRASLDDLLALASEWASR